MTRTVVIEFSLVDESKEKNNFEIIEDILEVIKADDFIVPWCSELVDIKISLK